MATSVTSGAPTLDDSAIQALAAAMRGSLIRPTDANYDEARTIYNAMIDKHPALIARCETVADVIAAVNFARDNDVIVAIRGGGHNGPGLGLVDDGLVIDLSLMNGVRVDPEARTARVEGGALLGDLHHATDAFGLATPSGIISTTGVGGITLGGGLGHLTRQFGLAIDNLLEADVVLADGRFVTASETENADLFWALRGGGGNFGVVTSFLFRLHPVPNLYAGPMLWPLERSAEVLRWYRDFITRAPDQLNGFFAFITVASTAPFPEELWNQKMCGVVWAYTGENPDETFASIRTEFGPPALDWVGPISHAALNSMFDGLYPPGDQWYWKADFVTEIPDEAVDIHVAYAEQLPTWKSTMHLYPIDGVAGRVAKDATAWNYRDAKWGMVMVGVSPDPADNPAMIAWTRAYWAALHPYSAGGAYVNMMMDAGDEGQDRVRASYGEHYDRLARIKAKYDPNNLFRVNQNIAPA
ncbi:MAG: linked oxidase domain protein [Thermomicrobiales bacterium]|jgi:FAD/FMN-containing dehydrogenase|nr:linked oxidase domain protein [Thermomicrobiales bacterium]